MRGNLGKPQKKFFSCGPATKKEGGGEVRVWPLKKKLFLILFRSVHCWQSRCFFLQVCCNIWQKYGSFIPKMLSFSAKLEGGGGEVRPKLAVWLKNELSFAASLAWSWSCHTRGLAYLLVRCDGGLGPKTCRLLSKVGFNLLSASHSVFQSSLIQISISQCQRGKILMIECSQFWSIKQDCESWIKK